MHIGTKQPAYPDMRRGYSHVRASRLANPSARLQVHKRSRVRSNRRDDQKLLQRHPSQEGNASQVLRRGRGRSRPARRDRRRGQATRGRLRYTREA